MKQSFIKGFWVAILLGLALALPVVLKYWRFDRPPVNLRRLEKIAIGTSREEVLRILGHPKASMEDNRIWAYGKPSGWSIVYVYFDKDGRFLKFEYDY